MHFSICQFDYLAKDAYFAPTCRYEALFLYFTNNPHTERRKFKSAFLKLANLNVSIYIGNNCSFAMVIN